MLKAKVSKEELPLRPGCLIETEGGESGYKCIFSKVALLTMPLDIVLEDYKIKREVKKISKL
jgi:hypothetical protein